jgi:SRSO17 transposase
MLGYVTAAGYAPLDRQLYLPEEWANDRKLRRKTHVPDEVKFQERWRIGLDLIDRSSPGLPFGWVAGDDEFGRASAFRAALRFRHLRYVLDVPCNTLVRDLCEAPAAGKRRPPWRRVDEWAKAQPSKRWRRLVVGAGTKGPRVVRVLEAQVQTRDEDGSPGPRERVVVIRTVDEEPQVWYTLSNAPADVPVARVVEAHGRRHGIEEVLQAGKGEVGLDHYEVRGWVGWHHHMTLSLLALWFLILENQRVGKKTPRVDGASDARSLRTPITTEPAQPASDSRGSQPRPATHGRGPHLSLAQHDRPIPAATTKA